MKSYLSSPLSLPFCQDGQYIEDQIGTGAKML